MSAYAIASRVSASNLDISYWVACKECSLTWWLTGWQEALAQAATHNADAHSSTEPEPGLDHEFLPVAGHPDDDECTHRPDGTDETYCGEPVAAHQPKYDQGHGADWSDWDMLHPDEGPSCECGYNGTPEECEASRRHQPHERACPACLHNEVHWADRENPDPKCLEPFKPILTQPHEQEPSDAL